jgi:hypothetical protein
MNDRPQTKPGYLAGHQQYGLPNQIEMIEGNSRDSGTGRHPLSDEQLQALGLEGPVL